jgi:hypothetical protein
VLFSLPLRLLKRHNFGGEMITKVCEICHGPFTPDRRVVECQRVCKKLFCQQERKRRAQQRWLAKNPDAFKGRYVNLKEWLKTHPGYLENYRHRRRTSSPSAVSPDIQDGLNAYQNSFLETACKLRDIQDELTAKITAGKRYCQDLIDLIYKTSQA